MQDVVLFKYLNDRMKYLGTATQFESLFLCVSTCKSSLSICAFYIISVSFLSLEDTENFWLPTQNQMLTKVFSYNALYAEYNSVALRYLQEHRDYITLVICRNSFCRCFCDGLWVNLQIFPQRSSTKNINSLAAFSNPSSMGLLKADAAKASWPSWDVCNLLL